MRIHLYEDVLYLRGFPEPSSSEDSSCLAYNSNKDEIYAFDTITEKIPIGSSCNSWSAPSERPASRACARAKRFARAPSITRLSSPRQVVTKFPTELTMRRVEMYKLSWNVGCDVQN